MQKNFNLYDVLMRTVDDQPEHIAFIGPSENEIYTYGELKERIESFAEKLEGAGLEKGACIGLHYGSGFEYIVIAYAIWKCNATVVPIAIELVPEEKSKICEEISLSAVISESDSVQHFQAFQCGSLAPLGGGAFFIPVRSQHQHPVEFLSINAAFVRFTSGTTSNSKGVILSHQTVFERICAANEGLKIDSSDTIVWLLSMSYHFTVSIVSYLSFGATIVVCRDHFGSTIVNTAVKNKATIIYGSPVHYKAMARSRTKSNLPDLRIAISTATRLLTSVASAFHERFGVSLSEAYGIIEVGLPCINYDAPVEKPGSVGRPLPDYQIRMQDIGIGSELKSIQFRGKGFLDAYYNPWKRREEIMQEGWFSTGDLGKIDNDGFLYIQGRSKEMISVAGMKFFPQETEAVLESYAGIKEAYVFPYPSERFGEVPHALLILENGVEVAPSEADLKEYCKRKLSYFKIPDVIQFSESLPRTASGKLLRYRTLDCPEIKGDFKWN